MLKRVALICWVTVPVVSLWAESKPETAITEFTVLRTERLNVPAGETTLNCSIVGSGDAVRMSCESQTSGSEPDDSTIRVSESQVSSGMFGAPAIFWQPTHQELNSKVKPAQLAVYSMANMLD